MMKRLPSCSTLYHHGLFLFPRAFTLNR
jgi:hypothetical protein